MPKFGLRNQRGSLKKSSCEHICFVFAAAVAAVAVVTAVVEGGGCGGGGDNGVVGGAVAVVVHKIPKTNDVSHYRICQIVIKVNFCQMMLAWSSRYNSYL